MLRLTGSGGSSSSNLNGRAARLLLKQVAAKQQPQLQTRRLFSSSTSRSFNTSSKVKLVASAAAVTAAALSGYAAIGMTSPAHSEAAQSSTSFDVASVPKPRRCAEENSASVPMRERMHAFAKRLQTDIVDAIEAIEAEYAAESNRLAVQASKTSLKDADGETMPGDLFLPTELVTAGGKPTMKPRTFLRDHWTRDEGGQGISCVLQDGAVFEKAGVMVSAIDGMLSPAAVQQMRARNKDLPAGMSLPFAVAGISLIIHPRNPHCPTVHFNFRYFEVIVPADPAVGRNKDKVIASGLVMLDEAGREIDAEKGRVENWFGGGIDLTPAYLYKEDAEYFHRTIKAACDKYDPARFATYKKDCDKYFYSPHRQEARGIGGVFFDDMNDRPIPELFEHVRDVGDSFLRAYLPIVRKRCVQPYNAEERRWQLIRRGRYVEFNLVHDRGTKFGLYTPGARIESILVSMPLSARWEYKHTPVPGSAEAELVEVLKKPREWA